MDDTQDLILTNSADAQALQSLVPDLVDDCPDLYAMAYEIAQDILTRHHITDITPDNVCLLYTSPSPRDRQKSRMPSSA